MRLTALASTVLVLSVAAFAATPASAAVPIGTTASATCTKQVLLLPGATTTCTTPPVACPRTTDALTRCQYSSSAVAKAAAGLSVAASTVSNVVATVDEFTGTDTASASCSTPLAVFSGCTATATNDPMLAVTPDDVAVGIIGFDGGPSGFPSRSATGTGTCRWTGGPLAALVTLTCTERYVVFEIIPIG